MRINIHYKITLTFVFIIALILSGIYLYLNISLKEHTYQRIKKNLLKETRFVRYSLEKKFSENIKNKNLDLIADEIGKELDLRVTIINLNGIVLGDSEIMATQLVNIESHLYRPEIQEALSSGLGESRRFSSTIEKEMLYIASIVGKTNPLGLIRLAIPLSEIESLSNHLKKLLILSLIFAFVLAIIISYIASIFISRPIKEISSVANSIAAGNFPKIKPDKTDDEIGDLSKAFQYMVEQIHLRIEEITVSKLRFEAVLLSMFEGVMVVDKEGTILLMNSRLKDFLLVQEDPVGKKSLEVIRNSATQKMVDNSLQMEHDVDSHEIVLLLPEEKTFLVHASPIIRKGKTEGVVLVFHDITDLKHLEKVRRDFVANVSHELRTPITSIKGYSETLLNGALYDKKNAFDFLKIIYYDSERVSRLIDDLLDLTKIESGRLELIFKPVILKTIIKQVVSSFTKQAMDSSITIQVDISEELPSIIADEMKILQVFQNLIDNAIKYNRKDGTVTISAKEKDTFIQVDVSDTGVGIPKKDLSRLFERFYRVDKTRSRDLKGTGLGLSIVKHIVQAHNGHVSVQSITGHGSTFSFTIPKHNAKSRKIVSSN